MHPDAIARMQTQEAVTARIYLAGEIHTDWRTEIMLRAQKQELPIEWVGPVLDHDVSDACGEALLTGEFDTTTRDRIGAGMNAIRSSVVLSGTDIVVARFALDQNSYPDWTSAYEAGRAVAWGKPLIALHDAALDHPLKEVDRAALAIARTSTQLLALLAYVLGPEHPTTAKGPREQKGADGDRFRR